MEVPEFKSKWEARRWRQERVADTVVTCEPHEALGLWKVTNEGLANEKWHMVDTVTGDAQGKLTPIGVCGSALKNTLYRSGNQYFTTDQLIELLQHIPVKYAEGNAYDPKARPVPCKSCLKGAGLSHLEEMAPYEPEA